MAKQLFGKNGQPAGGGGGSGGGGGNANVYITIPNVDSKDILLIGTQAKVRVSASTFDLDNSVEYFDLRVDNTQVLLDAVKDGKTWRAEYTFTVAGQSGDRLAIFCNAIDKNGLRSMTGSPQISPRLTESYIAAPVVISPTAGEYKTAGSIVIKGTEFVSLGGRDAQKAIHARVVLADDPQVVRWEGSLSGALTQITASWVPAGDGQEDLLCSLMYEGVSSGKGEWSEPVLVKLVKSGVSVPVITWPLNGEKYADPNLLRVNAEQPTVKSNSWTGTEWQVSEYADFSSLLVNQSLTETEILPNRVLVDLVLDGRLDKQLHLRCRHLTSAGPTVWSDVISFQTASHQTFWEFTATGTFIPPVEGVYEILCVGRGGTKSVAGAGRAGSGGGGGGYLAIGAIRLEQAKSTPVTMDTVSTKVGVVVALNGGTGYVSTGSFTGGNGGSGSSGGGGGGGGTNNDDGGSAGGTGGNTGSAGAAGATGGGLNIGAGLDTRGGAGGAGIAGSAPSSTNSGGTGGVGNVSGAAGTGYGGGSGGEKGGGSTTYHRGGGGGGGGGYGGGKGFDTNPYFASHLPFKNFNNITTSVGYVRIMYKGPTGEGA